MAFIVDERIDVVWPRLVAIAEEIAATLIRTAFSHDVIVGHDMSSAIFDDRGHMTAQTHALGTPGHIGAMPFFMKDLLAAVPATTMAEGDVFITNDPWLHCGHTADIYAAAPIFRDGKVFAFVVTCVHHLDVGGRRGSGLSEEVYEEGLLLPIVRFYHAGTEDETLRRIITRNVRYADKVLGDLRAQVTACFVGGQLLLALADKEGIDDLRPLVDEIVGRTESAMRASISALKDGSYSGRRAIEVEGIADPVYLVMTVTKNGDELSADFSGSSPQVPRPINCPLNYGRAYLAVAMKMLCGQDLPNNEGTYRPIHMTAPEGTIINPTYPAAVFWRYAVGLMVADLLFELMADIAPDRVPASSGSMPVWQYYVSGSLDDGEPFVLHSHAFGGMGARPGRDGLSSVSFPYHVREIATEIAESETPIWIAERELLADSGGGGQWRGGLGERLAMKIAPHKRLRGQAVLTGGAGRMLEGAQGLFGGQPGAIGELVVNGATIAATSSPQIYFGADDVVTMLLPGGGGYGRPQDRDWSSAQADVENGYVSR